MSATKLSKHTIKARAEQLKYMHELMLSSNDENIYMRWIYLMPDDVDEEEFPVMAEDTQFYNECFNLFCKLIQNPDVRW